MRDRDLDAAGPPAPHHAARRLDLRRLRIHGGHPGTANDAPSFVASPRWPQPAGASARRSPTAPRSSRPAAMRSPSTATTRSACATSSARTELASGTFYNYFPDKSSVFRAIVEETAPRPAPASARRAARPPDAGGVPGGRLPRLLRVHRRRSRHVRVPAPQPRHDPRALRRRGAARRARRARGRPARGDRARRPAGGRRPLPRARHARGRAGARPGARASATPPDVEGATRFATALFSGGSATWHVATLPRHALPPPTSLIAAVSLLALPAAAQAKLTVGIAENNPQLFADPLFSAARRQARARRRLLERRHGAQRRDQPRHRVPATRAGRRRRRRS